MNLSRLCKGVKPYCKKIKSQAYLDGFSPNVQEILDKFKFRKMLIKCLLQ